jgi:outer membrane protein OmpA-like peptidoglycan-associated protein
VQKSVHPLQAVGLLVMLFAFWPQGTCGGPTDRIGHDALLVLTSQGVLDLEVVVEGRSVVVSGSVGSENERARAEAALRSIEGVQSVVNLLEVRERPIPPPPRVPELRWSYRDGRLKVRGRLPDAEGHRALLTSLRAAFGEPEVIDRVRPTGGTALVDWFGQAAAIANVLAEGRVQTPAVTLRAPFAVVSGTVPDAASREAVLQRLREHPDPKLEVVDRLRTGDGPTPSAQFEIEDLLALRSIEFDSESKPDPGSVSIVDAVAWVLKDHPESRFEVGSHLARSDSPEEDRARSQRRAEALLELMSELGIAPERLVARGYGHDRPLVTGEPEVQARFNDRIELQLLD